MIHKSMTDQSIATGAVDDRADQIFSLVDGELVLQETGGLLTADGSEQTLFITDDPLGIFRPVILYVDLDNMAGGETTELRVYYRIVDGGALQLLDFAQYVGADGGLANSIKLVTIALGPTRFGIQVTLEQTAGTLRTYRWAIFEEAG